MAPLVANARMYAVNPEVERLWTRLFMAIGAAAGIELAYLPHPAPAPLEELWRRDDLGLAFMCGWPFANLYPGVRRVATPIPVAPWAEEGPVYRTDLVVDAATTFHSLSDLAEGRMGWTAEHSQSGYRAVVEHLWRLSGGGARARWVGPLLTPRRVVEALLSGRIDVGPLDSYWHDLLTAYEPQTAKRLRTVASTALRPMPLLVASELVPDKAVERLQHAAVEASSEPATRPLMDGLLLRGFAPTSRADYGVLVASSLSPPPWATDS